MLRDLVAQATIAKTAIYAISAILLCALHALEAVREERPRAGAGRKACKGRLTSSSCHDKLPLHFDRGLRRQSTEEKEVL